MYCVAGGQGGVKMEPGLKYKGSNWGFGGALDEATGLEVEVSEVVDVMTALLPTGACLENGISEV